MQGGNHQRGAVYVEFLIVFVPIFLFFLIIMQFSLLYVGKLGVRHAAARAVRSAVVILDDDPARYSKQERLDLQMSNCGDYAPAAVLSSLTEAANSGTTPAPSNAECDGGPRVAAIRTVASAAVAPYSPALQKLMLGSGIGGGAMFGVAGKLAYSVLATSVTFPVAPRATQLVSGRFNENDLVTTRVSFLQICPIPIASLFLCDRMAGLRTGFDVELDKRENMTQHLAAWQRLRDTQPAVAELFAHSAYPAALFALIATDARFRVFQAEASLPLQSANYPYQSELQ